MYWIAARVVANRWLPAMAALAFVLSYSAINVGLEARPYALATCLTLAALYYYLGLAETGFGGRDPKARTLFVCFMTLALLTHYSAMFVVAAAVLSPLLVAIVDRDWRGAFGRAWVPAGLANLLTIGPPIVMFGVCYVVHARRWVHRIHHLPEFMFDSARESLVAFGLRTARAEVELLTPIAVTGLAVLAAAAVVGAPVSWLLVRDGNRRQAGRRVGAILLPVMLGTMAALALTAAAIGRYPFGGPLRHQLFLFPFAILSLFVVLDRIDRALPDGWQRRALVVVVLAGCVSSISGWMSQFRVTSGVMEQGKMNAFRSSFPATRAIYLDQFSLIPFFAYYHDWQWRLEGGQGGPSRFRVWRVSKDGRELQICRDRMHWQLDVSDAEMYSDVAQCLAVTGGPDVTLFRLNQVNLPAGSGKAELKALMEGLAAKAGLRPESIVIRKGAVFAAFERGQR